ncbi:MAG: hypothetical protein Q4E28_05365 [Clostridia bacterium]|nr:hypothetical protein [Clostridia bacterium]
MTKTKKMKKSILAIVISLIFIAISILPAFIKASAEENAALKEYSNRETVIYPSASTVTTFLSKEPSADALFYINMQRVKNPDTNVSWNRATLYNGDDGKGTKINSAALIPSGEAGQVGCVETDTFDAQLLAKDYDITWVVSAPGKSASGWNWGDAFTFFNNPDYASDTSFDYGALGIYNKNYSDAAYHQKALSNAIVVEIDNYNDVYPHTEGNSARLDELWKETDEKGNELATGKDMPRTNKQELGHIAITIPEESKKAKDPANLDDWKNKENDGVRLPHYSARLMNSSYQGSRILRRKLHTIRIKWELLDPGQTAEVTDNTYRLTYYMYNDQRECIGTHVTAHKDFTYSEIKQIMGWADGDTQGNAKMALWGTSGALVGMDRRNFFPETYEYTVKYIDRRTRKPVLPEYQSTAPMGPLTIKAPVVDGYRLVSDSPVTKNISRFGKNAVTFYYQAETEEEEEPETPNRPRPERPDRPNRPGTRLDFASFFEDCKKRPVVQQMGNNKPAVNTGFAVGTAALGTVFALSAAAVLIASKKKDE